MPRGKAHNYIDEVAFRIYQHLHETNDPVKPPKPDIALYRMYALLLLAKALGVTSMDVHDAWSAWMAEVNPDHPSLIPFTDLSPEVQQIDDRYRDAIHHVAREVYPWA